MKIVYTWLLVSLGIVLPALFLSAQSLVNWPLTEGAPGNAQVQIPQVIGIPFERGNGLSALRYSGAGVEATSWSTLTAEDNEVDYYGFGLSAAADQTIRLSQLSFSERRAGDGPRTLRVYVSRDGFATQMEVAEIALPDNLALRSHTLPLDMKIQDGEELRFRIYGLDAESADGFWLLQSNTLQLLGALVPACPDPSEPSQLALISRTESTATVELTAGNGQARIVVACPAQSTVTPRPYRGDAYAGDLSYGTGDLMGSDAFVLLTTSAAQTQFEVTDLEPGTAYRLIVYEYNDGEMCYANEYRDLTVSTSCTTTPRPVEAVRFTSLDEQVAIRWEPLTCIERYLVVASESPIVGTPAGENFDADIRYGMGDEVTGLGPETYALYNTDGPITAVPASELTNGTRYYFAIFVLRSGQWSTATMFDAQPEAACAGLEPERIFINEIHYVNGPVSQDQGVEIAGPAGIDLSNYELVVSRRLSSQNAQFVEMYRHPLYGLIDDENEGLGAVWFPLSPMDELSGSIALVNTVTGQSVDLVMYTVNEGVYHRAALYGGGQGNSGQGLWETNTDPAGFSLQLTGEGACAGDFAWSRLEATRGTLNLGQAILPVEMNFLSAAAEGPSARIFWQTATESGSDYFELERSTDGRDFTKIGTVAAAGFSTAAHDYEYYDRQPAPGLNYYRLRQVDYDGTVYDEGIVTVRFNEQPGPPLTVFPNPVADRATLTWNLPGAADLYLTDAHGRTLANWSLAADNSNGSQVLDLSAYPAGTYFLRVQRQESSDVQMIVKQ